jgi:2-dehydro-3-deoxy-L-fuconate 4-dehydrogenase
MQKLLNKNVVVTAAAAGIGRATCELFQQQGATIWATDIDKEGLKKLGAQYPSIKTMVVDVTDDKDIQSLKKEISNPDVLFNCAGFVHNGNILDCKQDDWDFSFKLNVESCYKMIKAFLPSMLANGGGSIVNMSSIASSLKGAPNRFVYAATKAAVIGLTKSVAIDYVKQGIRCNAVCPGTIDSPSLQDRLNAFDDPVQARQDFEARQPIGRIGRVDEVAKLVLFLASDDSSYCTGSTYAVDGGWSI